MACLQMGDKTPDARVRTYADVMREAQLARERDNTLKNIADKRKAEQACVASTLLLPCQEACRLGSRRCCGGARRRKA